MTMAAAAASPSLHMFRSLFALVLSALLCRASPAFNLPPTRTRFSRALNAAQTNGDTAGEEESNRKELPLSVKRRCPDFPSFASGASSTSGATKVRVRRNKGSADESLTEDSSSWVYKVASEMPVEPGLFLDVENSARRTRLLKTRSYASASAFASANITCPPSLSDLDREPPEKSETFWISTFARFLALAGSILAFPFIIETLDKFVTLPPEQLQEIASSFGPGISIIYGTFVSLTLSVLYNRQQYIQDDVAQESALLTIICRNLLMLFADNKELAVESAQTVADQIRTLVKGSRGSELTLLMYSDPYSRMLELIAMKECQLMSERNGDLGGQGVRSDMVWLRRGS